MVSLDPTSKAINLTQVPPIQSPARFDKQATAFPTGFRFLLPAERGPRPAPQQS